MDTYDDYQKSLETYEQKAYKNYDKAILTLSGGALAISFTFIKDIAGISTLFTCSLLLSWTSWVFSVSCTLFSFLASQFALRRAINILEAGDNPKNIFGISHYVTLFLNIFAGLAFLVGTISFTVFMYKTAEDKDMAKKEIKTKEQTVEKKKAGLVPPLRKDKKPPKETETKNKSTDILQQ